MGGDQTRENHFADVTLVSDELTPFEAHKFVLSACSPVFKEILLNCQHSHPIIYLNGVKEQEVQTILCLLYFGEATFTFNRIDKLFKIVKEFKFKGIELPELQRNSKVIKRKSLTKTKYAMDNTTMHEYSKNTDEYSSSNQIKDNRRLFECDRCDYSAKTRPHLE